MSYRDDHDALREKLEAVRTELADSQDEIEALQHQLAIKELNARAARKAQRRLRMPPLSIFAGAALLLLSFAGAVGFLLVRTRQTAVAVPPAITLHPILPIMPDAAPRHWTGVVTQAWNGAPVSVGTACELTLVTATEPECRFFVRCQDSELYAVDPAHGYVQCAPMRSAVTHGQIDHDAQDGDPVLDVDWPMHQVTLSSADGWVVTVQANEAPDVGPR